VQPCSGASLRLPLRRFSELFPELSFAHRHRYCGLCFCALSQPPLCPVGPTDGLRAAVLPITSSNVCLATSGTDWSLCKDREDALRKGNYLKRGRQKVPIDCGENQEQTLTECVAVHPSPLILSGQVYSPGDHQYYTQYGRTNDRTPVTGKGGHCNSACTGRGGGGVPPRPF